MMPINLTRPESLPRGRMTKLPARINGNISGPSPSHFDCYNSATLQLLKYFPPNSRSSLPIFGALHPLLNDISFPKLSLTLSPSLSFSLPFARSDPHS